MSKQLDQPHLLLGNLPPHRPSVLPAQYYSCHRKQTRMSGLGAGSPAQKREGRQQGEEEGRDAAPSERHNEPGSKRDRDRRVQNWHGRMMLKLKLQYFGHLMPRVDSLEKTDAGRDWGQEEKGTTEDEMAGWHHGLDGRESE